MKGTKNHVTLNSLIISGALSKNIGFFQYFLCYT